MIFMPHKNQFMIIFTNYLIIDYPCNLKFGLGIFYHYFSIYGGGDFAKKVECHFKKIVFDCC